MSTSKDHIICLNIRWWWSKHHMPNSYQRQLWSGWWKFHLHTSHHMIKSSYIKLFAEATMIRLKTIIFTCHHQIIIWSNHHIIKSSNHQITKSSNDQITKSSNDQMIKSWSNQTMIRELNLAGNQLRTLDKEVTKPLSLIVFKFQVLSF